MTIRASAGVNAAELAAIHLVFGLVARAGQPHSWLAGRLAEAGIRMSKEIWARTRMDEAGSPVPVREREARAERGRDKPASVAKAAADPPEDQWVPLPQCYHLRGAAPKVIVVDGVQEISTIARPTHEHATLGPARHSFWMHF